MAIVNIKFAQANGTYYLLLNKTIHSLNINANQIFPISISFRFQKKLQNEFCQMFYETWVGLEENFYSDNFHGVDWNKIKAHYQRFLPYLRSRQNFRTLLRDMLGELRSSHVDIYSGGKEEKTFHKKHTAYTGIIFQNNSAYTVECMLPGSHLYLSGADIKKGDILVEVNGEKVNFEQNREYYFTKAYPISEMTLKFTRKGKEFSIKTTSLAKIQFLKLSYKKWIQEFQDFVDEKSKKEIAYIHMYDMGPKFIEKLSPRNDDRSLSKKSPNSRFTLQPRRQCTRRSFEFSTAKALQ